MIAPEKRHIKKFDRRKNKEVSRSECDISREDSYEQPEDQRRAMIKDMPKEAGK
jgi:hypothetical protein